MLASQRQHAILEAVQERGAVRTVELSSRFGVSEMTIRRDLDLLAGAGAIVKVHGGATAIGGPDRGVEPGFAAKSLRQREEKAAIARAAAGFVQPGMAIGLSAGTTTWTLAHELVGVSELTVVTNSIRVATVFHEQPDPSRTVILTGGERTPSDALVGPVSLRSLRSIHLDATFLGVHGMDEDAGFTTPNLLEAEIDRELVRVAKRLVVVADATKMGLIGVCTIAPLSAADIVITDQGLGEAGQEVLRERSIHVVLAGEAVSGGAGTAAAISSPDGRVVRRRTAESLQLD